MKDKWLRVPNHVSLQIRRSVVFFSFFSALKKALGYAAMENCSPIAVGSSFQFGGCELGNMSVFSLANTGQRSIGVVQTSRDCGVPLEIDSAPLVIMQRHHYKSHSMREGVCGFYLRGAAYIKVRSLVQKTWHFEWHGHGLLWDWDMLNQNNLAQRH